MCYLHTLVSILYYQVYIVTHRSVKMYWTKEAEERIKRAPFFIQGIAKRKAEAMAKSRGKDIVDIEDIELAKKSYALEDLSKLDLSMEGIEDTKFKEIKPCGGLKGCPLTLFKDEQVILTIDKAIHKENLEQFLETQITGPVLYHHKFKAAVSGCPNNCSQPQIKDIGVIGYKKPKINKGSCIRCQQCIKACPEKLITVDIDPTINYEACLDCGRCIRACPTDSIIEEAKGYRIIIGGRLGRRPHLAEHMLDVESLEELEIVLCKLISLYKEWFLKEKRFSSQVEALGALKIQEMILVELKGFLRDECVLK